jgi:hypothetical protein
VVLGPLRRRDWVGLFAAARSLTPALETPLHHRLILERSLGRDLDDTHGSWEAFDARPQRREPECPGRSACDRHPPPTSTTTVDSLFPSGSTTRTSKATLSNTGGVERDAEDLLQQTAAFLNAMGRISGRDATTE